MPNKRKEQRAPALKVDWGHLATVIGIGAWVLWYLFDARSVSLDQQNLLVVQPLSILVVVLLIAVLPQCIRREELPEGLRPESLDRAGALRIFLLMLAFGGLVALMFKVGFDLSVFLFCLACLLIAGERRVWFLAVFSLVTTLLLVKGYKALVPYPMPNLFL